jgi:hypothetical protein
MEAPESLIVFWNQNKDSITRLVTFWDFNQNKLYAAMEAWTAVNVIWTFLGISGFAVVCAIYFSFSKLAKKLSVLELLPNQFEIFQKSNAENILVVREELKMHSKEITILMTEFNYLKKKIEN